MRCLVTGCAGFIGSHISEALIEQGHDVTGIDCFTDYYPRPVKEANLSALRASPGFTLVEANLLEHDLSNLLEGVEVVYHQAAQAGVRASWGQNFRIYTENNIRATQRLLEAARNHPLKKFVYASSSSVYGDAVELPVTETALPRPISPYGVSKLAAEHLCYLYWINYGIPTVSLRYFTVYGPRQRPDMGFHKFIKALLAGDEIVVYGDGNQTRDFTFISDAVAANLACLDADVPGQVFNIGGGSRISVNQVMDILQRLSGLKPHLRYIENQKGDVRDTHADTARARDILGFRPSVAPDEGLRAEFEWLRGQ